jgi:hypothetical protein
MPDSTLCRRAMLSRCMAAQEPMVTRLAARSVFALGDDDLCSYSDVGRALVRFGNERDLSKEFAKALKASKQSDLMKLSGLVEKGSVNSLDKAQRKELKLTTAQKAALLAVFSTDEERAAHGGETGVYWLNRAVFLEANRNIAPAIEAHWEAMQAAESAKADAGVTANILQYVFFTERNLPTAQTERDIDSRKESHKQLASKVQRVRAELLGRVDDKKSAPFRARDLLHAVRPIGDGLIKELTGNPAKWGGIGFMLAADSELFSHKFSERRRYFETAMRSPSSRSGRSCWKASTPPFGARPARAS